MIALSLLVLKIIFLFINDEYPTVLFWMFFLCAVVIFQGIWLCGYRRTVVLAADNIVETKGSWGLFARREYPLKKFGQIIIISVPVLKFKYEIYGVPELVILHYRVRLFSYKDLYVELAEYVRHEEAFYYAVNVAKRLGLALDDRTGDAPVKFGRDELPVTESPAEDRIPWWDDRSALVLLVVNAFPVAGVLLFEWDILFLMLVYWLENIVIGGYSVLKMFVHSGWYAFLPALQFIIFFTLLCLLHGFFIAIIFGAGARNEAAAVDLLMTTIDTPAFIIMYLSLLASHGQSFWENFIKNGECDYLDLAQLMFLPFTRLVVLHATILLGGICVLLLNAPILALISLIILKSGTDLYLHAREHRIRFI